MSRQKAARGKDEANARQIAPAGQAASLCRVGADGLEPVLASPGPIFDLRPDVPLSQLASHLSNELWSIWDHAKSRPGEGTYIVTLCRGTMAWRTDPSLLSRLQEAVESFRPLAEAALEAAADDLPSDGRVLLDDERGKLWVGIFCDSDLARATERTYSTIKKQQDVNDRVKPSKQLTAEDGPLESQTEEHRQIALSSPLSANDRSSLLHALLATVQTDAPYEQQIMELEQLGRDFRQEVAATLLPAMKREIEDRPHSTLDDKKNLVKWANSELRRLGLAIRHPKTGLPATFVADPGNYPEEGRFQLRSEGKTFSTPELASLLNVLKLMMAPRREEGLAKWADRVDGLPHDDSPRR